MIYGFVTCSPEAVVAVLRLDQNQIEISLTPDGHYELIESLRHVPAGTKAKFAGDLLEPRKLGRH